MNIIFRTKTWATAHRITINKGFPNTTFSTEREVIANGSNFVHCWSITGCLCIKCLAIFLTKRTGMWIFLESLNKTTWWKLDTFFAEYIIHENTAFNQHPLNTVCNFQSRHWTIMEVHGFCFFHGVISRVV